MWVYQASFTNRVMDFDIHRYPSTFLHLFCQNYVFFQKKAFFWTLMNSFELYTVFFDDVYYIKTTKYWFFLAYPLDWGSGLDLNVNQKQFFDLFPDFAWSELHVPWSWSKKLKLSILVFLHKKTRNRLVWWCQFVKTVTSLYFSTS